MFAKTHDQFVLFGRFLSSCSVPDSIRASFFAKNTLLNEGVQAAIGTVFNTCERSLQNELKTSKQLTKNVQNLTRYSETTTIALMAFHQKFNVTGQYGDDCLNICFDI